MHVDTSAGITLLDWKVSRKNIAELYFLKKNYAGSVLVKNEI